ncbi:MAG: peptide deformylase [Chloroflexota bacterium]|nr:peptide deformylase [Chloroflexota bacterium]
MAVRPLVQANDPVLRKRAQRVTSFGPALRSLVTDMIDTMHAHNAVGLAAPQIGISQQILVIQLPEDKEENDKLHVMCNPKIARQRGREEGVEACLSLPGFAGEVPRATMVTVKGQDLEGEPLRVKAQGFLARVFQHEIDHLYGKLYIDRVEDAEKIWRVQPSEEGEQSRSA